MKDGKNLSKKIQRILTARSPGEKGMGQNECALGKSTINIFMSESLKKNLIYLEKAKLKALISRK